MGSADDMLWNDRKREKDGNGSIKCQGDEGTDCESRKSANNDGAESGIDRLRSMESEMFHLLTT